MTEYVTPKHVAEIRENCEELGAVEGYHLLALSAAQGIALCDTVEALRTENAALKGSRAGLEASERRGQQLIKDYEAANTVLQDALLQAGNVLRSIGETASISGGLVIAGRAHEAAEEAAAALAAWKEVSHD